MFSSTYVSLSEGIRNSRSLSRRGSRLVRHLGRLDDIRFIGLDTDMVGGDSQTHAA